jgi:copper transport protein
MIRRIIAALVLAAAVLAASPARPVLAHAALDFSFPSANSVLETSPPSILLDFDEDIDQSLAEISLFDQNEAEIELGPITQVTDGSSVQAAAPQLADGTYVVVWRVASADGHVVDGAFSFRVGVGSTVAGDDLLARVSAGSGSSDAVEWALGIARFLALFGIMVAIGAGVFGAGVFGVAGSGGVLAAGTSRLLRVAVTALLVGSVAAFGFYAAQAVGGGLAQAFSPDAWGRVSSTQVGRALLIRIVLALVLVGLLVAINRRTAGWWQGLGLAALVFAVVTFSASGHAYGQSAALPWIANDAIHLGAASLWMGGLVLFATGGRAWFDDVDRAATVRRFSRVSTVAIPIVVITGSVQTVQLAGGLDVVRSQLSDGSWGRVLIVKVVVVTVAVVIGGVSQWLLRNADVSSLRRTVTAEAVIGVVVIGLAAGLIALPPRPAAPAQLFTASLAQADVVAEVTVTPGSVGSNELHIIVTTPGGALAPIADLQARMTPVDGSLPTSPVSITKDGPNHYTGFITLPRSGDWTLEILAQVDASRSVLLSTTVPIPG